MRIKYVLIVSLISLSSLYAQEKKETLEIPEPLMFDLVRGLGAEKGELEINTLADFPLNDTDSRAIEWAPEAEYAIFDGFAVEAEFPFEDGTLEAIKIALQYTLGQSKSNKFIHGLQFISEFYLLESLTELSLLYVPAYRFNKTWSIIALYGLMFEVGSDAADEDNTVLLNTTLFANLNEHLTLGLELNNTDPTLQKIDDNEMELLILPQLQYEWSSGFELQAGIGPRFQNDETELSAVLRVIKTF